MKFSVALMLSICFHAFLGVVGVYCLDEGVQPDSLVQLDLSSVELSFAEKEVEAAPVAPPVVEPPPPPKEEEKKVEEKVEEEQPKEEPEPLPEEPKEEVVPIEPPPPPPKPVEKPKVETPPKPMEKPVVKPLPPTPPPLPAPPPPAPPPAAPRQAAIDAPARPRHTIKPDYPRGARARGEQGEVELEIEVGETGRVTSARVVHSSGYPELDGAALAAARSARFVPAKSKRKAVASLARLKLRFKLK